MKPVLVEDEVLQEIRVYREALAARFSYDIRRMFAYVQEQEAKDSVPDANVLPASLLAQEHGI